MNCKPGDLAIIVNEDPDCLCNIGAFVTVTQVDEFNPGSWNFKDASRPLKMVDVDDGEVVWNRDSRGGFGFDSAWIDDRHLRPIRDNDGEDETMTWAGKPTNIKETA